MIRGFLREPNSSRGIYWKYTEPHGQGCGFPDSLGAGPIPGALRGVGSHGLADKRFMGDTFLGTLALFKPLSGNYKAKPLGGTAI